MTCLAPTAFANPAQVQQTYFGVARDGQGQITYQERHKAAFLGNKVQKARTEYLNKDGQVIGELESDFRQSLNVPNYHFNDLRDGSSHGITLEGDNYVVWRKMKNKDKEQKVFAKSKFSPDTLVVGCQGLHYDLANRLQDLNDKKKIPIKYLIPGKLDYYSFTMTKQGEDQDHIYLKISIDSIFLKIFTSALELKYRKSDLKLLQYSGLSNIPSDSGDTQNVKIDYAYR